VRVQATDRPALRALLLLGGASGAMYGATYTLQRAMSPLHAPRALGPVAALYVTVTIALFTLYAGVMGLALRGALRAPATRALALVVPVLFSLTLTLGRPYLSIDVWTYVAQGEQARGGRNPYVEPVKAVEPTPLGAELLEHGWVPVHGVSPYGPLWTSLEAGVMRVTPDVVTAARLLKMIATAFSLASGLMIWLILGSVAPRLQLVGTLAYLWNPVVVMELGAEGHNDSVMIFFVLLSLFLWLRHRPGSSVVALTVGALVKVVTVMVAPLELVYAWRTTPNRRRLLGACALGGCAAMAIAAAAYAPFWIGSATFEGIREHGRPGFKAGSTSSVFYWYLTQSHSEEASARLLSWLMSGTCIGYMALTSLKVKDAQSLLRACGRMAVVYLVVAPGYWPWYAAMPIALLALAPDRPFIWSIVAVSLASRLAAPLDALRLNGVMDWEHELFATTIVGVWLPVGAIGVAGAWQAWTDQRARRDLMSPTAIGLSSQTAPGR
jgi:hypothetical protein